ncbi:polysaccharide pyruvyl transferase family protein, partial [Streptomyces anulatus]
MTHPDPSTTPGPAPTARTESTNAPAAVAASAPAAGSAPTPVTASADDRRAVTGKRRIAFAVYVADAGQLVEFQAFLRSLALTNPALCEDVVVLHPGLPDASFDAAHRLHPRLIPRTAGGRDDVFRLDGYDTVIALTPALVVLGRIDALLRLRTGVAAVPHPGPNGAPGDGLLVIQCQDLDHPVPPAAAEDIPESDLVPLDRRYDFRALRLGDDLAVPEGVVVLNFAGVGGAPGPRAPPPPPAPDPQGGLGVRPPKLPRPRAQKPHRRRH